MLLNTINTLSKLFCIPMALYVIYLVQVPLSKMVKPKENFVIFLTLFVLSFSLSKLLLLFGAKLLFMLFMLLIAFPVLSSKIKLHMRAFLGHLQTITTFALSALPVSFFFSRMSIQNLPWSRLCCFLGYGKTQKGYWCYDPISHCLPISHNVVFWEHFSFV